MRARRSARAWTSRSSSNLERLLFELYGRDGDALAELMAAVPGRRARFSRSSPTWPLLHEHCSTAAALDDEARPRR